MLLWLAIQHRYIGLSLPSCDTSDILIFHTVYNNGATGILHSRIFCRRISMWILQMDCNLQNTIHKPYSLNVEIRQNRHDDARWQVAIHTLSWLIPKTCWGKSGDVHLVPVSSSKVSPFLHRNRVQTASYLCKMAKNCTPSLVRPTFLLRPFWSKCKLVKGGNSMYLVSGSK